MDYGGTMTWTFMILLLPTTIAVYRLEHTAITDILQYPPQLIPTYFNALFPLSSLGSLGFLLIFLFLTCYIRR